LNLVFSSVSLNTWAVPIHAQEVRWYCLSTTHDTFNSRITKLFMHVDESSVNTPKQKKRFLRPNPWGISTPLQIFTNSIISCWNLATHFRCWLCLPLCLLISIYWKWPEDLHVYGTFGKTYTNTVQYAKHIQTQYRCTVHVFQATLISNAGIILAPGLSFLTVAHGKEY
jgi:hypothetical protein